MNIDRFFDTVLLTIAATPNRSDNPDDGQRVVDAAAEIRAIEKGSGETRDDERVDLVKSLLYTILDLKLTEQDDRDHYLGLIAERGGVDMRVDQRDPIPVSG